MKTSKTMLRDIQLGPESDGWIRMVNSYEPMIAGWLKRFGVAESDVADVSQEVFCTVIDQISKFDHNGRTGAFRKWLKSITIIRCRRYWDNNKRLPVELKLDSIQMLDQLADPSSDLSGRWDREHDQFVLAHILNQISKEVSEATMTVFRRFAVDGESAEKIAREMGLPIGQIYKLKFRVMQRLKQKASGMISSELQPFLNKDMFLSDPSKVSA